MKKLLLIIAVLLFAGTPRLSAQSFFVKAGLGFASQWGATGLSGGSKISLGYEHEFSQTFTFAPSIGVVGRGWQIADCDTPDLLFDDNGNMVDKFGNVTDNPAQQAQRPVLDAEGNAVPGQFMYSTMHRSYSANYVQLDLPFVHYSRLAPLTYVYVTAGPWVACGFAGKRKTEGDGRAAGSDKVRYTDKTFSLPGARRIDCGLKAGVGVQLPSSLTIGLEADFGLLPTNKVTGPDALSCPFGHRAGRNANLLISLSYRLNKSYWRGED